VVLFPENGLLLILLLRLRLLKLGSLSHLMSWRLDIGAMVYDYIDLSF
jgi:hypothetical protein